MPRAELVAEHGTLRLPPHRLEILTPLWHAKAETARAVRQRIRSVLEWAIAMDLRNDGASLVVYCWCMARTNVDVDDEACAAVMRRYRLATKREAVNFALRSLASEPFSLEEARRMRGAGWDGDLDEMRGRPNDPC